MQFLNLNVKWQLGLSYGVLIVLLLVSNIVAIQNITDISDDTNKLYNHSFTVSKAVLRIDGNVVRMHRSMKDIALSQDEQEIRNAAAAVERYETLVYQDFDIIRRHFLGDMQTIDNARRLVEEWRPIRQEVITLMLSNKRQEAANITKGIGLRHIESIQQAIKIAIDFAQFKAEGFIKHTHQSKEQATNLMTLLLVIGILIAVIMGLIISRSLATPLQELSRLITPISDGDLTIKIHTMKRRDEVGLLWNAFGEMVTNLRSQIKQITESADILAASSSEISASTVQLASGTAESAAAVGETSATVEEVRQTAEMASQKAKLVSDGSQTASETSHEGLLMTESAVQGMIKIKKQMELIAESTIRLSEQSQAIGDIITTVGDLAEQSNLLAVNASIEAVKAGEYGKGFSVVALEIRRLAEQSKKATNQVRTILNDIQKAVSSAVLATEQGGKVVTEGEEKTQRAGEAIRGLTQLVTEAAQAASQIAASSQQQLVGMDQVAMAIANISQATDQSLSGSKQVETEARNISEMGQQLKSMVAKYKL